MENVAKIHQLTRSMRLKFVAFHYTNLRPYLAVVSSHWSQILPRANIAYCGTLYEIEKYFLLKE